MIQEWSLRLPRVTSRLTGWGQTAGDFAAVTLPSHVHIQNGMRQASNIRHLLPKQDISSGTSERFVFCAITSRLLECQKYDLVALAPSCQQASVLAATHATFR